MDPNSMEPNQSACAQHRPEFYARLAGVGVSFQGLRLALISDGVNLIVRLRLSQACFREAPRLGKASLRSTERSRGPTLPGR